jgi:hypothetical protein
VRDVAALESLVRVRKDYGLPCEKPCIAVLLDGYVGDERHNVAFLLAIEWRRLGVSQRDATQALNKWAEYRLHEVTGGGQGGCLRFREGLQRPVALAPAWAEEEGRQWLSAPADMRHGGMPAKLSGVLKRVRRRP